MLNKWSEFSDACEKIKILKKKIFKSASTYFAGPSESFEPLKVDVSSKKTVVTSTWKSAHFWTLVHYSKKETQPEKQICDWQCFQAFLKSH